MRVIAFALAAVAALLASPSAFAALGDSVPRIDATPSCRGASRGGNPETDLKNCLQEEEAAHQQLLKDWKKFKASDRAGCVQLSTMGGEPSYVELLTCLEMAAAAREAPPDMLMRSDLFDAGPGPAPRRPRHHHHRRRHRVDP